MPCFSASLRRLRVTTCGGVLALTVLWFMPAVRRTRASSRSFRVRSATIGEVFARAEARRILLALLSRSSGRLPTKMLLQTVRHPEALKCPNRADESITIRNDAKRCADYAGRILVTQ